MTINLCFHGIGSCEREREPGESAYWISPDFFGQVLDLVAGRPDVRLSFDDGNQSDVAHALPALLERGLTATFFVVAGRIGVPGSLSSSDLRRLVSAGMTLGSHGMNHRPWPGLDDAALDLELVVARQVISEESGQWVTRAACPLGRYDRRVLARLRRCGYEWVGTSDRRPARENDWLQPRFSIRVQDSIASLEHGVLRTPPPGRRLLQTTAGVLKRSL